MASAILAALAALFSAFSAIELLPILLELQSAQAAPSTFDSAVQVFLPLAATVVLFAAVAVIHLHDAAAVGAGNNQRLPELVPFTLCAAVGTLVFSLFVLPAGDVGALARELGRAAVHGLPASTAVVFFLGITLLIAHIRAGGEGGGGGGAAADRRDPEPVNVLKKIVLAAAAALLGQIAIAALYIK